MNLPPLEVFSQSIRNSSSRLLARMIANVVLEGAVGAVPLAGDAFDVFFRANRRNVALLRQHFARSGYG